MNPKIDWFEIFFSSSGRVGAVRFTIAAILLLLILGLYDSTFKGAMPWLSIVVYAPLLFCGACVLSKRLHDRGRSGWWSAVILLAVAMVWPGPEGFLDFVAVLVLVWAVIDLCIMPGERGNNRYGPTLHRPVGDQA